MLNSRLSAVRVCSAVSSLRTVIVAPGLTVKLAGVYAKFLMTTVIADTDSTEAAGVNGTVFVPLLPAVRRSATPTAASAAVARWRTAVGRAVGKGYRRREALTPTGTRARRPPIPRCPLISTVPRLEFGLDALFDHAPAIFVAAVQTSCW